MLTKVGSSNAQSQGCLPCGRCWGPLCQHPNSPATLATALPRRPLFSFPCRMKEIQGSVPATTGLLNQISITSVLDHSSSSFPRNTSDVGYCFILEEGPTSVTCTSCTMLCSERCTCWELPSGHVSHPHQSPTLENPLIQLWLSRPTPTTTNDHVLHLLSL